MPRLAGAGAVDHVPVVDERDVPHDRAAALARHDREEALPVERGHALLVGAAGRPERTHQGGDVLDDQVPAHLAGSLGAADQLLGPLVESCLAGAQPGGRGPLRDQLRQRPVLGLVFGRPAEQAAEGLPGVVLLQGLGGAFGDPLEAVLDQRVQQRFLVGKVAVHGPDPDAGSAGDLLDLALQPLTSEALAGGLQHGLAVSARVCALAVGHDGDRFRAGAIRNRGGWGLLMCDGIHVLGVQTEPRFRIVLA